MSLTPGMDSTRKESPILNYKSRDQKKSPIKQLLFDLDNTLYSGSSSLADEMHRRMNDFVAQYLQISEDEALHIRSEGFTRHGTTLRWLQMEKGLSDPNEYLNYVHPVEIENYLIALPELRAFLKSIPLPKSILTNSPIYHAQRILDFYGIADCFDHVFDLSANNYEGKPFPSAYLKSLATLGRNAEETVFIDDIPSYLDTFDKLGGHCILVDEKSHHGDSRWPVIATIFDLKQYIS